MAHDLRFVLIPCLLLLSSATLLGCSEPAFAAGDCVQLERRVLDYDLKPADCATARGTFDASERTYKVDEVIEGTDGQCGPPQGFFPVSFSHGPDDVTYCLSQAD